MKPEKTMAKLLRAVIQTGSDRTKMQTAAQSIPMQKLAGIK